MTSKSVSALTLWCLWLLVQSSVSSGQALQANVRNPLLDNEAQIRQQRDRDQQELERLRRSKEVDIAAPPVLEPMPVDTTAQCFEVEHLVLQEASLLDDAEMVSLQQLVEGHCVGMTQLSALLNRITNVYIGKGYVTTRAYIPEQNLASGRLEILVVEGRLESIDADKDSAVNLNTAFPGLSGEYLNLRDIEQGLAQINRLQSNNARMTLEPGSEPGLTRIVIHNAPTGPWSGDASWDNFDGGSNSKFSTGVGYDNALGLNDYFSLRLRKDTAFDRGSEYSENYSFNGVIPYGRWTYSLLYAYLRYSSHIQLPTTEIESRGSSASWYLNADRLLYRDPRSSLLLNMSVSRRDTRNYLADVYLDVSSRTLSAFKLGLSGSWRTGSLRLSSSFNVKRGLKVFGSLEDQSTLEEGVPKSQFLAYDARLALDIPVQLAALSSHFSTSLSGQYTKDALFGSEHFTVAGFSAVRGYEGSAAAGRGAHSRSEWSVLLPYSGIDWLDNPLQQYLPSATLNSFIAYDYGETFERFGNDDRRFSSWSLGLNGRWKNLNIQFTHSGIIHNGGNDQLDSPISYASVRYQF